MKLCGCKETCFERGECWGHLAGVMCKHLSEIENETGNGTVCYCLKYKVKTARYDNSYRYNQLKKEKEMESEIREKIQELEKQETELERKIGELKEKLIDYDRELSSIQYQKQELYQEPIKY